MIRLLALSFMLMTLGTSYASISTMEAVTYADSNVLTFNKSNYSFVITWQEGPKKGGSRFTMKTWKNDLGTMNGPFQDLEKNLHIYLWMPGMGHGSAPVKITKINDGEYDVSNVQFIMGGKWDIRFQLKEGAQVLDEVIIPLTI